MYCLLPLLFVLIPNSSAAIRCFSGQQTTTGQGIPFTEVNCPSADFCFNNYVKRHHNGDDSVTITKSCGEPGKCFETGCEGPSDELKCCCVGNLCNSAPAGLTVGVAGLILALRL
ncbi:hypothetical protein Aduo_012868 [Ancylostoma duodenale]